MHQRKEFILIKDRYPRVSDVLWDCTAQLCVPASKNECLTSILVKLCGKITSLQTQITTLQATIGELEDRIEQLEA